MNVKRQVEYWSKTATDDLETAQIIYNAGKNYHHCLFFCHLVLEKGLKANVAKATAKIPPRIHNLILLAEKAKLELSDEQTDLLTLMNTFNIEGRYPDMQYQIYKSATKSLTKKLLNKTKEQFKWMEKLAKS